MKLRNKIAILIFTIFFGIVAFISLKIEKKILYSSGAKCTCVACYPTNPCCNSCISEGWRTQENLNVYSLARNLTACEVDGCGVCSYHLESYGFTKGNSFYALWKEKKLKE